MWRRLWITSSHGYDCSTTRRGRLYDIPSVHETLDISWLRRVELPVVVLTPEARLRVANGPRCRILTYPVRPEQIVKALAELGVEGQTE